MNIKINRKFNRVNINNIDRIEETPSSTLVRLKNGYPRTLKADCDKSRLLIRMVNAGVKSERIQELRDK